MWFLGPCIGGIIVAFTRWRIIYWLQVGLAGLSLILSSFFIPNEKGKGRTFQGSSSRLAALNPINLLEPLVYPNIVITVSHGLLLFDKHQPSRYSTALYRSRMLHVAFWYSSNLLSSHLSHISLTPDFTSPRRWSAGFSISHLGEALFSDH